MNHTVWPGEGAGAVPGPTLSIGVLGPMEVRYEDVDRTPTAQMARRVLALLLLNANRAVPVSTFVEELWEDVPPRLARKTIQTYMYQLRKGIEGAAGSGRRKLLETRPNGYLIRLAPAELDLWEFDRLVDASRAALAAGQAAAAAGTLRSALGLWRGAALADIEPGPLLQARAAKLEDARLGALELRIEADLRLGRHRSLLGELRELTGNHPLNESFSAQLMLAACRAGQRGIALDTYARLRQRLVEELGIEPSERLQKLQHDVLTESPALGPPDAPPPESATVTRGAGTVPCAQLPPDSHDFVGRDRELSLLISLSRPGADSAVSGPPVIAVVGAPGLGKSAVAVRAAHTLRDRFPDGQLYAVLHDAHGAPLAPSVVLRSLLHDVGVPSERIPAGLQERARMFRSWCAERALLVLLDDAASADQLLPLLPAGGASLVLITSRTRLPGLPGAATVPLRPLDTASSVALLAQVTGPERVERELAAAREIVRLCGHLPLGVRAAGEKLAARPMRSLAAFATRLADEHFRLDELRCGPFDVRARLRAASERLTAEDRWTLRRLSRGPRRLGLGDAARLLELDARCTEILVGSLLDSHVLEEVGEGRFAIPELLRLTVATGYRDDEPVGPGGLGLAGPPDPGVRGAPTTDRERYRCSCRCSAWAHPRALPAKVRGGLPEWVTSGAGRRFAGAGLPQRC